jgi:hypothetical protein
MTSRRRNLWPVDRSLRRKTSARATSAKAAAPSPIARRIAPDEARKPQPTPPDSRFPRERHSSRSSTALSLWGKSRRERRGRPASGEKLCRAAAGAGPAYLTAGISTRSRWTWLRTKSVFFGYPGETTATRRRPSPATRPRWACGRRTWACSARGLHTRTCHVLSMASPRASQPGSWPASDLVAVQLCCELPERQQRGTGARSG